MKQVLKAIAAISVIFSLTSFSCNKKKESGEPYSYYEVMGTVYGEHKVENTDTPEEGDFKYVTGPVKGIKVSSGIMEPVYTNELGNFVFYGRQAPSDVATLVFADEDGSVNGGPYQKLTKNVRMILKEAGGDRGYAGTWFASGVEVNLILKTDHMDTGSGFN
jgi:putative lipoprotein (rSAM/lipoprotein system)